MIWHQGNVRIKMDVEERVVVYSELWLLNLLMASEYNYEERMQVIWPVDRGLNHTHPPAPPPPKINRSDSCSTTMFGFSNLGE